MTLEHSTIPTIITSIIIGFGVAVSVKYGMKPKIERIYEKNRDSIIRRLLIDVNNVSNQFNDAHEIFEMQHGFPPEEDTSYDLTVNEVTILQNIHRFISRVFHDIATRRDTLLFHLQIDEYEAILNYLANSVSFYTILQGIQPNQNNMVPVIYLRGGAETTRRFGWRIINLFPQIINYEFIQNMRKLDRL